LKKKTGFTPIHTTIIPGGMVLTIIHTVGSNFIGALMDKKQELLKRLFKERYHSVYSFFLKRLGSSENAEDACQETFMRMVRHNGTISLNSPDSYLFRVARNLATDVLRTRAVRSKYTETIDIEAQPSTEPLQDAVLDSRKQQELIQAAISELPPRCREVFVLHQLKDLTYEQTAERLNISPNTVKNHYVKALLRLRTVLTSHGIMECWNSGITG
jgi:RNA polymerase sigma-70 factor (ECF subfamily)